MNRIPKTETLLTNRCRLRYPSAADIPHIWSATRHPGFNDGMQWDPPATLEELHEPLERHQKEWAAGTAYTWTIEHSSSGDFLGRISIRTENRDHRDMRHHADELHRWSIGFWIHPEQQRNGYAAEAASAIVDFGFQRLGARRISAAHATWNDASRRVLERIGMRFVRVNPRGYKKRGEWVAEHEYEITAEERAQYIARPVT